MSNKKQEMFTISNNPGVFVVSVWLIFLVFCIASFVLLVLDLYLVCQMLSVILDWSFLIFPSNFSNVYLYSSRLLSCYQTIANKELNAKVFNLPV